MSTALDSRLGQLFVLEMKSPRWSERMGALLRFVQPAGVIVPLNKIWPEDSLREVAKNVSSLLRGTPLLGKAAPHVSAVGSLVPAYSRGISWLPESNLVRHAEILGNITGGVLRKMGLNVDFSLWLDLTHPGPGLARGLHSPDRDPRLIAQCAAAYLRGLRGKRMLACARDFPGIGSVESGREGGWVSAKPMAALWREDLLPFRELMPKLPLVMVSRAVYKAYDFDSPRPAVFSCEIVTGLLRSKLGYKGVAVANLSELLRARKITDVGEAAVKALEAGCDLLIVPGNKSSVESSARAMSAALDSGRMSAGRLEQSLRRIRALKMRLAKPVYAKPDRLVRRYAPGAPRRVLPMRQNEKSV
jgi:beta-N-acetylhexosaminidase